jgi:hypothetical protein
MVFFLFGIFAGELLTTPLTNVSRLTISYRDDACALSVWMDGWMRFFLNKIFLIYACLLVCLSLALRVSERTNARALFVSESRCVRVSV